MTKSGVTVDDRFTNFRAFYKVQDVGRSVPFYKFGTIRNGAILETGDFTSDTVYGINGFTSGF